MAENPYIGEAMGLADSGMADAIRAASAVRSAAQQQQRLQEQRQKQAMAEQLDMARLLNEGWRTYEPSQNVTTETSGLKRRDYVPPPANLVTLPTIGKQLYRPAQTRQEQQQGFTDLREALNEGGQPVVDGNVWQDSATPRYRMDEKGNMADTGMFGAHVPVPDQSRVVTPPGSQQGIYMPTQEQTAQQKLREHVQQLMADEDAQGWTPPDALADALAKKAGLDPGSLRGIKVPHEAVAGAFGGLIKPPQEEKPDATSFIPGMYGPKGGPILFNKNTQSASEVALPAGSKREPTPGQAEATARAEERRQDREDARRQREEDANQKVIETLQGKADALDTQAAGHRQRGQAYQRAIGVENGTLTGDPEGKSDVQRPMKAALRTRMAQQFMDAKSKADAIDKQSATLKQEIESRKRKFAPAEGAAQQTGGGRGGAGMQAKSATMDQVRSYAQQKGIGEAQAIREFQGSGYKIGQ
jgi:hypothetical protein